jgi:hypothetical protein
MRTILKVERYGQDKSDRLNRDAMEHRMSRVARPRAHATRFVFAVLVRAMRRKRRAIEAESTSAVRDLAADRRG